MTTPSYYKSALNLNVTALGLRSLVCAGGLCRYTYSAGLTPVVQEIYLRDTWVG